MRKKKNLNFLYVLILALFMTMIFSKSVYATQIGTIEEMSVKVYENMNEDSAVVANIIYGSRFTILSEEADADGIEWCFVQTDLGIKGYIKKEYMKQETQETIEIQKKQQIEFVQNVNIRLQPTTEAEIVGRVPQHTILEPVQTQENELGEIWYQIEYEGIMGFVRESTVDIIEVEETVENVEEEPQPQTNEAELVEPEPQISVEMDAEIIKEEEKQDIKIEKSDTQENDKQEKKSTEEREEIYKVTTRKAVNPIDEVVIRLGLGSLLSAFLALLVIKLMRKEQRKTADNNKNSRRKGKKIC